LAEKKTPYDQVTDQIVASLEKGVVPWVKPWNTEGVASLEMPHNAAKKNAYRGVNVLTLWAAQMAKGYKTSGWMTMKQANQLGGKIRKGERATWVVFWKFINKTDDRGNEVKYGYLTTYMVFNVDQIDGLPEDLTKDMLPRPIMGDGAIEERIRELHVDIRIGGTVACYHPVLDYVNNPEKKEFKSEGDYYSTLLHEVGGHWTGHESRLNRKFGTGEDYAFEELVAELTSAFLCAEYGIPLERLQHAEYVGHWIKNKKNDNKAIMRAASLAQKAADYFMGRAPKGAE